MGEVSNQVSELAIRSDSQEQLPSNDPGDGDQNGADSETTPTDCSCIPCFKKNKPPLRTSSDGQTGTDVEATELIARRKKSPWFVPKPWAHLWLAFTVLMESTNLISTMLYMIETYQRAAITELHEVCGDFTLIPIMPKDCPAQSLLPNLPPCHAALAELDLCEADAEVRSSSCPVTTNIDNCGSFDVYRKVEHPKCSDIGCATLSKALWLVAFTSYFATTSLTCLHHIGKAWTGMDFRAHIMLVTIGVASVALYLTGFIVGLSNTSSVTLFIMMLLSPAFPISVWSVALIVVQQRKRSTPSKAQTMTAAMELPLFNALVAVRLNFETADDVIGIRKRFGVVLRVVEDLPDAVLGVLDLWFFGGSWFAIFSLMMSILLVAVEVIIGSAVYLKNAAKDLADEDFNAEAKTTATE